ncbi:efflux RND transporter periplasmic adaptor subunit [Photobacterium lutimaris]|uniref:Efflux transporter periplasmic adaptor subunit n=1 Tax=Photobacterium lutimaris TaxID=388278 RepID=A0A2T3J0X5_9GAMM|nr:efflux RND transporter periplasmic adaptor subunit [Photobacterium lutimaris]PSU34744.1 efflux transporter periplasmic adaptor subunit [Photobacterium lutimaris]TDR77067.1 membrane fusion protein (multidrug efflux system) [Photobacterium lutimaris]
MFSVKQQLLQPFFLFLALLSLVFIQGCEEKPTAPPQTPQYDIGYVTVATKTVELRDEMPGRTIASYQAEVRPQVGGIILRQLFEEGTMVQKGQPLYQIDPAPFQLLLDQARSDLNKASANLATARNRADRYRRLVREKAVSRQDYDDAVATYQEAQSNVASAKASVENAKINLNYTKVNTPIDGRAGRSSVTAGALVTANQSAPLVTVQTYNPMHVDLTASSTELLQFRRELAQGAFKRTETELGDIQLSLEDGTIYDQLGTVLFSDINIDETTGSFVLRVSFPNPQQILLPGMFVRASLPRGIVDNAILIPAKALTRTPKGDAQVSIIGQDNKVEVRTVKTERLINNQWLITQGLNVGEKVIVDGLQFVRSGAPVSKSHEVSTSKVNNPSK